MNQKKNVLIYGDSNTYGYVSPWSSAPTVPERFSQNTRYGSVVRNLLQDEYNVIEEGLNGRTTIYTPSDEPYKNGENYLLPCLLSHKPLSFVSIMLGTNDLRLCYGVTEKTLGVGIQRLVHIIQNTPKCGVGACTVPQILLIAPVLVLKPMGRQDYYLDRGEKRAEELSALFASVYQEVAKKEGCLFLNAQEYASCSLADGLHITAQGHNRLGQAVASIISACP